MSIYYLSGKYKLAILSFLEYCYRIFGTQYFVRAPPDSKGCLYLVDDKNVHNIFFQSWTWQLSSLSLVMTQSFQSPFYMKYYFSTVSLNTTTIKWEQLHLKLDRTLTDWLTQQAFMGDIPSQIHPFPITLWRVILIFMLRYCI